jgi:hypothetical protein
MLKKIAFLLLQVLLALQNDNRTYEKNGRYGVSG